MNNNKNQTVETMVQDWIADQSKWYNVLYDIQ